LVPHKNKISLAYWETASDLETIESEMIPGREALHLSQDIRLVVWFNYGKMGKNSPSIIKTAMIGELMSALDEIRVANTVDPSIKVIRLDLRSTGSPESTDDLFSRYTYLPKYRQLFKKPYSYFALDFECEWTMWKKCIPAVLVEDSIVC